MFVLLLSLALPLTAAPILFGQSPSAPTARVVVRFQDGKTSFRLGEDIRLELEFRGRADLDFYFSTENYDRSGRLTTEQYAITPREGFVDPLSEMFADGFIGGGLRSEHPLNDTPFLLHVTLNEWARFTKPGAYRLVVTSDRLHTAVPRNPVHGADFNGDGFHDYGPGRHLVRIANKTRNRLDRCRKTRRGDTRCRPPALSRHGSRSKDDSRSL